MQFFTYVLALLTFGHAIVIGAPLDRRGLFRSCNARLMSVHTRLYSRQFRNSPSANQAQHSSMAFRACHPRPWGSHWKCSRALHHGKQVPCFRGTSEKGPIDSTANSRHGRTARGKRRKHQRCPRNVGHKHRESSSGSESSSDRQW